MYMKACLLFPALSIAVANDINSLCKSLFLLEENPSDIITFDILTFYVMLLLTSIYMLHNSVLTLSIFSTYNAER